MAPYRELRTNLYLHDNLRQKSKNIQWRKDSFLISGAGETGHQHMKESKHFLKAYTKIN